MTQEDKMCLYAMLALFGTIMVTFFVAVFFHEKSLHPPMTTAPATVVYTRVAEPNTLPDWITTDVVRWVYEYNGNILRGAIFGDSAKRVQVGDTFDLLVCPRDPSNIMGTLIDGYTLAPPRYWIILLHALIPLLIAIVGYRGLLKHSGICGLNSTLILA